jgi:ABC-type transport system substrate-binding protein
MSNKKLFVILAVVLAILLCLCLSCGGLIVWFGFLQPGTGDLGVESATSAGGGTLRLFDSAPSVLDPALVQDATSAAYVIEIFSGLVTLDEQLRIAPDLAERWEISADGKRYTFFLREGVQFQDGKPVQASDFKYSLERACSPQLASPVAASYLGDIVGAQAVMQGQATEISGVRVLDERTLEITIDSPKSYFLSKLTYSTAFVVDKENVQTRGWTLKPNGTGPFRLVKSDGKSTELVRNERYYRGTTKVERVIFTHSGGVPATLYENGELDIAQVGAADVERVQDVHNPLHDELLIVPNLNVQYIGLNAQSPPFDDVNVRRAFNYATDRDKLAEVVQKGTVTAALGILPPMMPGYNNSLAGLGFDPALARRTLAASKYGGELPPIVLHISGEGLTLPRSVQALLAMWQENLGVQVSVESAEWSQFLQDLNARRYQMFMLGWVGDYPDPHNFLDLLFYSGSGENHLNYANTQVDRLLEQARIEQDAEKRAQLYQQIEQMIVQDAAWVPLWHDRDYWLIKPYLKGVKKAPTIIPWLKDVEILKN